MTRLEPLISILMPAYNTERFIAQSLQSLLDQSYNNWELLVADDGSTDQTKGLIDSFDDPRIIRFHQAINQGYLKTWNRLLQKARGEYITFLDADDYIHKDRLRLLVNFLNRNPDVHLCGSGIAFVDDANTILDKRVYPSDWEMINNCLYNPNAFPFCGSAVMISRKMAETVGGYRLFFDRVGWEDHDWLIRCCEHFRASNLPDVLYYYRHNPSSVSRTIEITDFSVRKLVIKKIGLELALQRKLSKSDFLMEDNQVALQALIKKYELPYRKDPSRVYRILCRRALNNKDAKSGLRLALQGLKYNFFHPSNYLAVVRSSIALLRL